MSEDFLFLHVCLKIHAQICSTHTLEVERDRESERETHIQGREGFFDLFKNNHNGGSLVRIYFHLPSMAARAIQV